MADKDMKELHDEIVENAEVENEEVVEEAHDPVNAEAQSIASVDKTDDGIKKVPDLKGQGPLTKAAMIGAMYKTMSKMGKEQLSGVYSKVMEGVELTEEELVESVDTTEALSALVEGEATLSEEFKEKTSLIFEAALRSKLSEEVDRLEESYKQELAEEVAATKSEMVDKIDSYLNYVVESWMEDNKLAIEAGIRTEIAENFMNKLKDVFVESYIEVPESKVDLVDNLALEAVELEEKLNEATAKSMELAEEVKELKRAAVLSEAASDLAQTQAEKLNALVEGVAFEDSESFARKVATIKESFFKKETVVEAQDITESFEDEAAEEQVEVSAAMAQYLKYLTKK